MAALATQYLADTGALPTFTAASTSDTAEIGNGHNTFIVYRNTNGAIRAMNVVVPGNTFFGLAQPDNTVSVPATTGEKWIPLRKEYDDGTGRATITVADATGVTVAVVRLS